MKKKKKTEEEFLKHMNSYVKWKGGKEEKMELKEFFSKKMRNGKYLIKKNSNCQNLFIFQLKLQLNIKF